MCIRKLNLASVKDKDGAFAPSPSTILKCRWLKTSFVIMYGIQSMRFVNRTLSCKCYNLSKKDSKQRTTIIYKKYASQVQNQRCSAQRLSCIKKGAQHRKWLRFSLDLKLREDARRPIASILLNLPIRLHHTKNFRRKHYVSCSIHRD